LNPDPLLSLYGNADLLMFGFQYGMSGLSKDLNNDTDVPVRDSAIQALASPGQQSVSQGPQATGCIVCTDDFSATIIRAQKISQECSHVPSVCQGCLVQWIQSQLESRGWDKIECPECNVLLAYHDIQRLADPATFSRYVWSLLFSGQIELTSL
jgi:hypothetical protein